ncbi:hypothetical protein QBC35DRAFT_393649 [Podospora australis]|uniref:Uncharacterized protein n=1 Tax=Podospora australis TaxID=1536484 RepID=A0AAN6WNQ0_9PEZI|nr:hypothetical protein QBC35DRAFT_393649 [Podospora australis]
MGSAVSRCNSKNSSTTSSFSEIGQKVLDKQPNWLVTPSRWRSSHHCSHQPVRYRTPTPYPKDDRKRCDDLHLPEKTLIIEAPVATHIEVASPAPHKHPHQGLQSPPKQQIQAVTITWEQHHPRLNRFERIS